LEIGERSARTEVLADVFNPDASGTNSTVSGAKVFEVRVRVAACTASRVALARTATQPGVEQ